MPWRHMREWQQLQSFKTLALQGEFQFHAPTTVPPWKNPPVTNEKKAGWSPRLFRMLWWRSPCPLPGIEPQFLGCSTYTQLMQQMSYSDSQHTVVISLKINQFILAIDIRHLWGRNGPTHSLTPCSRVHLEKVIVPHLVKKFPTFY